MHSSYTNVHPKVNMGKNSSILGSCGTKKIILRQKNAKSNKNPNVFSKFNLKFHFFSCV